MLAVLRQRNFALLWGASLISEVGTLMLYIALPFYVYAHTGSTLATGAMFVVQSLPAVALGSLVGVFVDRWDRRRTMMVADLARAVLILLLLTVRARSGLWAIYVVAGVEATISLFFYPASGALAPVSLARATVARRIPSVPSAKMSSAWSAHPLVRRLSRWWGFLPWCSSTRPPTCARPV